MTSTELARKADNLGDWNSPEITQVLLDGAIEVPVEVAATCLQRLREVRDRLEKMWVLPRPTELGPLTDWILSGVLGRENVLLLGPPGTAKSNIATTTFRLLGLSSAMGDAEALARSMENEMPPTNPFRWWLQRIKEERRIHKMFHFQFSRFTSLEEVFGPMEISLLKRGTVVRINFNMLTGPGVRAAFLDELFKATGALLNALLQVLNERTYFNWGVNWPADVFTTIAASNELPGAFGGQERGAVSDDFSTLYALLDRLSVRLIVNTPSGISEDPAKPGAMNSPFAKAAQQTLAAEGRRLCPSVNQWDAAIASPNDVLALSRAMMQGRAGIPGPNLFDGPSYDAVWKAFVELCCQLQPNETRAQEGLLSWSISARKTRVWKVLLAHTLLSSAQNLQTQEGIRLNPQSLHALSHIWDSQHRALELRSLVQQKVGAFV